MTSEKSDSDGVRNAYCMRRGWMEHSAFNDLKVWPEQMAWCWMIEKAVWKDTPFRIGTKIITLKRGQLCYSLRDMAEAWGWKKDRVKSFLNVLESQTMTRQEIIAKKTVITIANYERNQLSPDKDQTKTRQRPDKDQTQKNKDNTYNTKNTLKHENQDHPQQPESNSSPAAPEFSGKVYAFHGSVVKVVDSQLVKWQASIGNSFSMRELREELERIDKWWQRQPQDKQKNWFIPTSKMLEKKNRQRLEARPEPARSVLAEEYKATAAPSIGSAGFEDYILKQTGASNHE